MLPAVGAGPGGCSRIAGNLSKPPLYPTTQNRPRYAPAMLLQGRSGNEGGPTSADSERHQGRHAAAFANGLA